MPVAEPTTSPPWDPPELPVVDRLGCGPRQADPGGVQRFRVAAARLSEHAGPYRVDPTGLALAAFAEVVAVWSGQRRFSLPVGADRLLDVEVTGQVPRGRRIEQLTQALRNATRSRADRDADTGVVAFTTDAGAPPAAALVCHAELAGEELLVTWTIRAGVFPVELPAAMAEAFGELLDGLATTHEPWRASDLVGPPAEQLRRRLRWNSTEAPLPDGLLHEEVVARCRRTPDEVVLIAADATLTCAELLSRAYGVAERLRAAEDGPGQVVAVALPKSAAQVVAVFGVLLAGAAYLPLDPGQPAARRDRILADAGVRLVLVPPGETAGWPAGVTPLDVDAIPPAQVDPARPTPSYGVTPDDLAYVIYTSGSTGAPKGVLMSHRAARNTVDDVNRIFKVGPGDRVLSLTPLSFDLSVYDLFGPPAVGGALVLPDPQRRGDPGHWAELVARHDVTLWNSVPAQLQMTVDHIERHGGAERLAPLRVAMLSGDKIPVTLPDRVRALRPGLWTASLGGATEAAIWSIWYSIGEVGRDWSSIPYGIPMANQTLHVLDADLRPCPDWTVGELFIGGAGLARGYLGDPEKTAQRFVTAPDGQRLYRTGDLVRYHPDGFIELLGRDDRQVKIRGHRVEPGEVEAALLSHEHVREAVVVAAPDPIGEQRLVAYWVGDTDRVDAAELRAHLRDLVPEYMMPAAFQALDAIPLTPNGKIDRAALPPVDPGQPSDTFVAPRTELERALAAIWCDVMRVERVGLDDDFFELGGHSMLATQVVAEIRSRLGLDASLRLIFDEPTVRGLALALEPQTGAPLEAR